MSVATGTPFPAGHAYLAQRAHAATLAMAAVWVFSGALVFVEPSPYEVAFLGLLGISLFGGVGIHRDSLKLLGGVLAFLPFSMIAVFQVRHMELDKALLYNGVTVFLLVTSFYLANFLADAPVRHTRLVVGAYTVAALMAALLGTLAYLGLLPGADFFLLYGRAKALFNDPNVYGPFLILPAMYALQRCFIGTRGQIGRGALIYLVLFVGIFVSFSRGAWGYLALSSGLLFLLIFWLEAKGQEQVRMLLLAIGGIMVMVAALMALLSIDSVAALFAERFSLTQSYDTGATGRFGRIGYAVELAIAHPWGLGPLEFSWLNINEQPHNTYINVVHAYGWGGGFAFIAILFGTAWRGIKAVGANTANRLLLLPALVTYLPLLGLAAIIDTDHWRHLFLLVGLVWGLSGPARKRDGGERLTA